MASGTETEPTIPQLRAQAKRLLEKLTPNQSIFVAEYLKDRNGTRAYLAAYRKTCKSENAAAVEAHKLLRNPKIKSYLEKELEIIRRKLLITPENLLREESLICFRDIRRLFAGGVLLAPDELPDDIARIVESVQITTKRVKDGDDWVTENTYKYKLSDKGSALGRMERHLGMLIDKTEHSGPGGGPIPVKEMSKNEIARRLAFALLLGLREGEKENEKAA